MYTDWQWMIKKDGEIFRDLGQKDDFTVLVNLTARTSNLEFFIIPTFQVDAWLTADFEAWVRSPGKNGRPHDPSNKKRNLNYPKYAKRLATFLHDWEILWR